MGRLTIGFLVCSPKSDSFLLDSALNTDISMCTSTGHGIDVFCVCSPFFIKLVTLATTLTLASYG